MKNLSEKVDELKDIKQSIRELYKRKGTLEKEILEELKNFDFPDEKCSITLDGLVEIEYAFERLVDYNLLMEKYPEVYKWGQRQRFDYKQALLSFDNPKVFWRIMNDCRKDKHKVKIL